MTTTLYERIINGGFEADDPDIMLLMPTGWITNCVTSPLTTSSPKSGIYCIELNPTEYIEQILPNYLVDDIVSLSFWYKGGTIAFDVVLYYSDSTSTNLIIDAVLSWTSYDLTPYLVAGKTLTKIRIDNPFSSSTLFIDDVSLLQEGAQDTVLIQSMDLITPYILTLTHVIEFEEEIEVAPALKDVPKRLSGQVIEYDMYVEKPTSVTITARLTDAEKLAMLQIFDLHEKIHLIAGPFSYVGWIQKPDIKYDWSKESETIDECNWRTTSNIVVEDVEYSDLETDVVP